MKPMLAKTKGPRFNKLPCFVQPKLNGVRALYQSGVFQSRDEKLWNGKVLAHLLEQLDTIQPLLGDTILDGELYVHGWRLQRINGAIAVNRKEPIEDTLQIEYHVFDTVETRFFSSRWPATADILQEAALPNIRIVPTDWADDHSRVEDLFKFYTAQGYEGVMLRPDGVYQQDKRSEYLWKYKNWLDAEFICVGTTPGEGKADIGIGALVVQVGNTTCKVGTGFDDSERILFAKNPPLGKLIRVRFLELTKDGSLFNPSFIAVMN